MKIGIEINGVLRDTISKFKSVYDKFLIQSTDGNEEDENQFKYSIVEPINTSIEECEIIERQAIARACRIGQKKKVSLIRILIRNTIEEDIYKKNYAHKNIKEINNNNEIEI